MAFTLTKEVIAMNLLHRIKELSHLLGARTKPFRNFLNAKTKATWNVLTGAAKILWNFLLKKMQAFWAIIKNSHFWKRPKFWYSLGVTFLALLLFSIGGAALWISSLDISKLRTPLPQPTFIYDQAGNKISELSSSRIEPASLKEVSENMKDAIVAIEDKRFYTHKGVDVWAILRALVRDLQTGEFSEGGSTITQQLAKNLFLPSDKIISRKLKEAGYALKIELTLSKAQILEAYLNQVYYGEGRWGIQEAAHFYFGKTAKELKLEEAALLAGIINAPSLYSPFSDKDKALERRNLVLANMEEQGYITATEYEQAFAAPIALRKEALDNLAGKYSSYVDYVIEEAITRYGFTQEQILSGGLQIYTELDSSVQDAAEEVYQDDKYFPAGKADQIVQSGITIIDQSTGGIRGLVGARGKSTFRQFNHASQLKRQPGSAFKPLAVYAPALETGYRPDAQLYDAPLTIDGYSPKDWDSQTRGWVTMEEAIENSWNIPAVWLLNEIGIDGGRQFALKAGIPLQDNDKNLSLALGGLSEGVSPLAMAQAYSAFANQGIMKEAHAISKITLSGGHVLAEARPKSVQLMNSHNAYTMTLLLQSVVKNGTGKNAAIGNRPVAGKTGSVELPPTTEFSGISKGQKDVWFVGYTPELTAAIWMGYDTTDREHYLNTSGGAGPAVVFHEVISRALANKPIKAFTVPAGYKLDWRKSETPSKDTAKPKDTSKNKSTNKDEEKSKNNNPSGNFFEDLWNYWGTAPNPYTETTTKAPARPTWPGNKNTQKRTN